ncbi:hypothetical protein [Streptomyces sp. NPDC059649]|uniref:hypothetical protein n=1 Tax=Streptomyces sp. NPDC059649 TaxID=3346895 RepID=UPI0036823109
MSHIRATLRRLAGLVRRLRLRRGDAAVKSLEKSLTALSLGPRPSPAIRVGLRRYAQAEGPLTLTKQLLAGYWLWGITVIPARQALDAVTGRDVHFAAWWERALRRLTQASPEELARGIIPLAILGSLLTLFLMLYWVVWLLLWGTATGTSPSLSAKSVNARRWKLLGRGSRVISACAAARTARGQSRTKKLGAVARALDSYASAIVVGSRRRGTVHRRSHRQRGLSEHARKVVAVLRQAESRLDEGAEDDALRDIAQLVLTSMDRYATGALGTLLDASVLAGVTAVPDRGRYKPVAAVAVVAALGVVLTLLDVPATVTTYVISAVGIIALSWAQRGSAGGGLDLLDSVRGMQRS